MLDKPRDASTDGPADTVQEVVPYCEATNPCPEGYVCLKDPCEASIGRCTRKPDTCEHELINLVCGCDTITYNNECEMLMAGQSKKYDGACITASCGWDTRFECGPGNYCEGICGDTDGVCLPVPAECEGMPPEEPVCGCNDAGESVTYLNQCDRILANAWYEHPGSCDSVTGCREGDATTACGPTMFCEGDEGACGSDLPGWCVERPLMCEMVYEPVCGCNDMTYGNDCERQMAGVWRNYVGECRGTWINCTIIVTTDGSISQEGCPDNMFCELPPGICPGNVTTPVDIDLWGICVDSLNCDDPPLACGDDPMPVCGCNGVQYEDDCARRNAKAQVGCCEPCAACSPIPPT